MKTNNFRRIEKTREPINKKTQIAGKYREKKEKKTTLSTIKNKLMQ